MHFFPCHHLDFFIFLISVNLHPFTYLNKQSIVSKTAVLVIIDCLYRRKYTEIKNMKNLTKSFDQVSAKKLSETFGRHISFITY